MTEKQCIAKIKSMKKDVNQYLDKECLRLIRSGGIDVSKAADDYAIPKVILAVALENVLFQWEPIHPTGKRAFKNLRHF